MRPSSATHNVAYCRNEAWPIVLQCNLGYSNTIMHRIPSFSQSAYAPVLLFTLRARWLFIILMLAALLVPLALGWPVPWLPLALTLLFLVSINGLLHYWLYSHHSQQCMMELGLLADVLMLTELLYLTGGIANPMASLYLPPLLLAALVCSARFAWGLALFCISAYFALFHIHLPFPIPVNDPDWLLRLHMGGMWLTFALSAALITACITWLIQALNWREKQLQRAHAHQQQNEQVLSLGIEAAHTAHKLSTPLNNLLLLVDELQARDDLPADAADDVALMQTQLLQCRDVLWQLKPKQNPQARLQESWLYATLAAQLCHWRNLRPDVRYHWQQRSPIEPDLCVSLDPLFWSAFLNILNNAADAGEQEVALETEIHQQTLIIGIRNRSGFLSDAQLHHAGLNAQASDKPAGLGMGVLLSHATLSRMHGSLTLHNHRDGGVYAEIRLPLTLCPHPSQD